MKRQGGALARAVGFGLVTMAFAVTQPLVLVALPLTLMLVASGPRNAWSVAVVVMAVGFASLGERSGLWWFERGWPLLLAGLYVWVVAWRPSWGFTATALAALGMAVAMAAAIFVVNPGVWLDIDTLMAARATRATEAALALFGGSADETVRNLMRQVAGLQVAVFPALLSVSSMGALGLAVTVREWLVGATGRSFGQLRSFSFSDHLVGIWLLGLALIVAPVGELADRIGGNAVLFMGLMYVLRGFAVFLSLTGGISMLVGIVGGLVALLLYPLLAFALVAALIVGLGDTWLNIRSRLRPRDSGR